MTLIAAKQISKLIGSYVKVSNITTVGTSINITTTLTTALLTAGYNGGPVPVVHSSNEASMGVITSSNNNVVFLFNAVTKEKVYYNGNQIYGRIVNPLLYPSYYTIIFYYLNSGVETAYTFLTNITLDYEIPYRFLLKDAPTDGIINNKVRFMPDDCSGGSGGGTLFKKVVIVNDDGVTPNQIYNAVSTATAGYMIWVQPGNYLVLW